MEKFRIASWNLRNNAGAKVWQGFRQCLGVDILLLQESQQPSVNAHSFWRKVPGNTWGSAIVLSKGRLIEASLAGYEGWVVGGEIVESDWNDTDRRLFVFSLHAPSPNASQPRSSYIQEVENIVELLHQTLPQNVDLILGGDFNFVSLGQRQDGEFVKTKPEESEAFNKIEALGLVSCWGISHPNQPLAQTLRWSGDKSPNKSTPFHCDDIFVPKAWRERVICEIFTSKCFTVSDHYPVAVWLCPTV